MEDIDTENFDLNLNLKTPKLINLYRFFFAVLGWFTLIVSQIFRLQTYSSTITSVFEIIFGSYRYFTMQTNLFVVLWLTFALIWRNDPENLSKIMGIIKGGITLYITVTFIVFAVVLSPYYQPTGIEAFLNLMTHYLLPLAFIGDWILTENNDYEWRFIPFWFVYPILYLCFAVINGLTTGNYLYPFLDLGGLGETVFIVNVIVLVFFFTFLFSSYILIAKKILPFSKYSKSTEDDN